ncbi:MAG TPA: CaiB/BaiF CoA-transferase family protein [Acidimicrobiales bacterium]|nr:CaiB/BaiF CoA-transferase family protein [Acidimicrobiales bacterium]
MVLQAGRVHVSGPLSGVKIVELAGIGPAPYGCMLMADAGADILRLERAAAPSENGGPYWDITARSRRSVAVDLKRPEGVELVLDLVAGADALVEGFRPGVAERLGVGPDECLGRNPRLVYARMTGWGQDGPLADRAGHDIDYIAIAGALWPMGRAEDRPVPPLNLVGDFGGGGMLLAFGVTAALLEAARSGQGQVVDVAMVDGAASLLTHMFSFHRLGIWKEERGVNLLDTGAPFYEVYETADGQYMAVGGLEAKFYAELVEGLGLAPEDLPPQNERAHWPETKQRFAAIFATKTRAEWEAVFEGTDACAAPVLPPFEAHRHPHNQAHGTYVEVEGIVQPAPVPRFGRTPATVNRPPSPPGADTDEGLSAWGVDEARIKALRQSGVVG